MTCLFKILLLKKFFRKTSWCLQHFLTMEFYRKICNNCYWSNFCKTRQSPVNQILIVLVSFASILFMSFFYLPTDPANSNKFSFYLRWISFLSSLKINIRSLLNKISNKIIFLSSSVIDITINRFIQAETVTLNSSFRI
jgi:tryptophan-rich sensory protein